MNALLPMPPDPAPVLKALDVARLLNFKTAETFEKKRAALEVSGFPQKLPGLNGWSRACVLRWIETNGETSATAAPIPPPAHGSLDARYAS